MARIGWKGFVGGLLVGSIGLELLRDKGADKALASVGAGVLVAKDWVMERVEKISLRASDVYADAKVKADAYLEKKNGSCCGEDQCTCGKDD